MVENQVKTGGCHCGAIKFRINGETRGVINCHCGQCLTIHGHFAAYSNCARENLQLSGDEHITWYHASPEARRGFCLKCGSKLFWQKNGSASISIAAGAFDRPNDLKTIGNIYVSDKPDYYEINDGLPAFPESDNGVL